MDTTINTIDAYIAAFPEDVQKILEEIRKVIKQSAPGAEEAMKYGIPTFVLNGNLVHFGGFKNHIGFYPTPRGLAEFDEELSAYEGSKGTVKFPLDKPIPYDLIRKIVAFRLQENLQKSAGKVKKK